MKCTLIAILLFIWLVPANAGVSEEWLNQPVSVSAHNEPLGRVLDTISSFTGVTFVFDRSQSSMPVSLKCTDTPLQQVMRRLFSHQNQSFIINNDTKNIIIKSLGDKQYLTTSSVQTRQSSTEQMSLDEINQLQRAQYKEYIEEINDSDRISENGMRKGEVEEMQWRQYQQNLQTEGNGDSLLEDGLTRGQLHVLHNEQYTLYELESGDSSVVIEGTAMTRGQLHDLQLKQYKDLQEVLADDSALLEDGISKRELHKEHLQQYSEYKHNRDTLAE